MPLLAIEHVQLAMPRGEEAAARKFYAETLGLPELPKPPQLETRGGAWFESSRVKIHLGVDADFRPAQKAHPAFLVDDRVALLERIRARGYRVVDDEPLEGYERAYVFDPFGNRIELMQKKR